MDPRPSETAQFTTPPSSRTLPFPNLGLILAARMASGPDGTIVRRHVGDGWQDVPVREFYDTMLEIAGGLYAAGVRAGDRVAILSRTCEEWSLFSFAIWQVGAVCVPIYETSAEEQVEWILSDSGARAVLVESPEHADKVASARAQCPQLEHVWSLADGGLQTLRQAGRDVPREALEQLAMAVDPQSLATIIYTSGTTGRPKGCEVTHAGLLAVLVGVRERLAVLYEREEDTATLLFLPLAHILARIVELSCIIEGRPIGYQGDTTKVVELFPSFKPSFIVAVPRVLEKVYNGAAAKAEAGGALKARIFAAATATAIEWSKAKQTGEFSAGLRLRHKLFAKLVYGKILDALGGRCEVVISGGSALGERLGHFFNGIGLELIEGYGMTESSGVFTANPPGAVRIGTVGTPIPGVSLRIAEDGEVQAQGPVLFRGYWRNPEATAKEFDGDWFRTGDLGSLDADGYLTIVGRKKEIIVTAGGKNVAPTQIEDLIKAHPLVSQAVLTGENRSFVGALITLDPEALDDWARARNKQVPHEALIRDPELIAFIQRIVDSVNSRISRAESVRKFQILAGDFTVETGELTPTLKLKRAVVMKNYASQVDALYAG